MRPLRSRVENALAEIHRDGATITVTAVATRTGISRATLYRHPELITLIRVHRATDTNADTLTTTINQLHSVIEALAIRVRQHEERLRHIERSRKTGTQGKRNHETPAPDNGPD